MPRRFNSEEETRILETLHAAGRANIGSRGVRKTTVEELARAAGIAKGSFYRFYASKEELALTLLAEWERGFHDAVESRFHSSKPRGAEKTAEVLLEIFLSDFPAQVAASGMQGLFHPDEIAYLQQRADSDHLQVMDDQDIRLFDRLTPLLRSAGLKPAADSPVVIAALRLLFDAALSLLSDPTQRESTITTEHTRSALKALIHGSLLVLFRSVR